MGEILYIEDFGGQLKFPEKEEMRKTPEDIFKKIKRKELMDKIRDFVDYAYNQGSKNCALYYVNFSKILRKLNPYDYLDEIPDIIDIIDYEIEHGEHYKNIYQKIKNYLN